MPTAWSLSKRFDYKGQSVAYDTLGEGDPVVLVHGTPFSSFAWRRIARELARDRKVYVFDLLGYGQSEKADGQDVSLGVRNSVLAELLRHWRTPIARLPSMPTSVILAMVRRDTGLHAGDKPILPFVFRTIRSRRASR